MSFPSEEVNELMKRFEVRHFVYTTRIEDEKGKYQYNEIVDSPIGLLRVCFIDPIPDISQHPFLDELTESQQNDLCGHSMDLILLERFDVAPPLYT